MGVLGRRRAALAPWQWLLCRQQPKLLHTTLQERVAADSGGISFLCRQQQELQQLQSSLQKDVQQLQQALIHYREQTERLECQKQLLIKQVNLCQTPALWPARTLSDIGAGPTGSTALLCSASTSSLQVLKLELTVEELQHTESELHADLARAFTEGRQARKTVTQLQVRLQVTVQEESQQLRLRRSQPLVAAWWRCFPACLLCPADRKLCGACPAARFSPKLLREEGVAHVRWPQYTHDSLADQASNWVLWDMIIRSAPASVHLAQP